MVFIRTRNTCTFPQEYIAAPIAEQFIDTAKWDGRCAELVMIHLESPFRYGFILP